MESLLKFIIPISLYNSQLLFSLSLFTYFHAKRKDTGFFIGMSGMIISSLFFLCNGLFGLEASMGNIFITKWEYSIILIFLSLLPAIWFFIVKWFCNKNIHFVQYILVSILPIVLIFYFYTDLNFIAEKRTLFSHLLDTSFLFYLHFFLLNFYFLGKSIFLLKKSKTSEYILSVPAKNNSFQYVYSISSFLLAYLFIVFFCLSFILWKKNESLLVLLNFFLLIPISYILTIFGKAVISYEILNGNTLPKNSIKSHWKITNFYIILINIGIYLFSLFYLPGFFIILFFIPIYFLVYVFFKESKKQNQEAIALKELLGGEELFESIFNNNRSYNFEDKFYYLIKNILKSKKAILIPLNFPGLEFISYPDKILVPPAFTENQDNYYTILNTTGNSDWIIQINLNQNTKKIGYLFLTHKEDHSLYSEEEILFAKYFSERYMELMAVNRLSKLLLNQQKEYILENKLHDHKLRRLLHDEILPKIHTLLLETSNKKKSAKNIYSMELTSIHGIISKALKNLPVSIPDLSEYGFIPALTRLIEKEFFGISIQMKTIGPEKKLETLEIGKLETIYFAIREFIRNSIQHFSRSEAKLKIEILILVENDLKIQYRDNGIWTYSDSGSGQNGLLLHSTMISVIGGKLERRLTSSHIEFEISVPI